MRFLYGAKAALKEGFFLLLREKNSPNCSPVCSPVRFIPYLLSSPSHHLTYFKFPVREILRKSREEVKHGRWTIEVLLFRDKILEKSKRKSPYLLIDHLFTRFEPIYVSIKDLKREMDSFKRISQRRIVQFNINNFLNNWKTELKSKIIRRNLCY